jgi:hypothetical protein
MNKKEDVQSPSGSNQKPRPSKLTVTKVAILVSILMILVRTYGPKCSPPYILDSNLVPQDNSSIPDLHNKFFPKSYPLPKLHNRPRPQHIRCDSVDGVMHHVGALNITDEFHLHDSSQLLPTQDMRGIISVKRGPSTQISDVEIEVAFHFPTSSPKPEVRIGVDIPTSTIRLAYTSTECIEVDAILHLKPNTQKRMKDFTLRTEILDLNILESLSWTIDNLSVHSSHGNTSFSGTADHEPMITHNVSVSTISGAIFGNYVADAHLHLHGEAGHIGGFIMPRFNSNVPISLQSITATTSTGNIRLEMVGEWENWPVQSFSHTTNIHTQAGCIWVALPHGSQTNVTSSAGNMSVTMIPFGTASKEDQSDIQTFTVEGDMYVHVYNTLQHTLKHGQFDPLKNMRSRHKVDKGNMLIRYPYGWYGDMEAMVSKGELEFDGSKLKDVEEGEGWVRARRGSAGESFMESWVMLGNMDVKIGSGLW